MSGDLLCFCSSIFCRSDLATIIGSTASNETCLQAGDKSFSITLNGAVLCWMKSIYAESKCILILK